MMLNMDFIPQDASSCPLINLSHPQALFIYFKKFLSRYVNSNRSQKLYIFQQRPKTVIKTLSIEKWEVNESGAWFLEIIFHFIILNVKHLAVVLSNSFTCF